MISGKSVICSFLLEQGMVLEKQEIFMKIRGDNPCKAPIFNLFASQTFTQICTKFSLELQCVSIFRSTTGVLINPFGSTGLVEKSIRV